MSSIRWIKPYSKNKSWQKGRFNFDTFKILKTMKNEIFDNMLSRYDLTTEQQKRNAIFEVNQQVILAGLYAGGFFESAAFYGGTCLRIFHGLQRFSEDMDFSLLTQDDKFDFTKYFPAIVDALNTFLLSLMPLQW